MKWIRSVMLFVAGIAVGDSADAVDLRAAEPTIGHRINHVGISVTNFEESLKFYTQVMGFKEAYRFPSQNGQPSTTFLQVNRDTFIEMAPANGRPAGLTHIGLYSEDAQASVDAVSSGGHNGRRLSSQREQRITAGERHGPNSIRIEINEQPAGSLMRKAMEAWK